MTGLQRKSLASFSIVICLLVFVVMGTTAVRDEDLIIKELKYEIADQDEGSVSLVVIAIIGNKSGINYRCDLWIDVLSSRGEKIGSSGEDGVSVDAHKDTKVSKKIEVPKKAFSPPLKLKGTLRNVQAKH